MTSAGARRAGGGAAARARVEGAGALSDARAFQAANPALGAGAAGLAAFRRWRAAAGRGGAAGDAPAEQVPSRPRAGGRGGAAPTPQDRPRIDAQAGCPPPALHQCFSRLQDGCMQLVRVKWSQVPVPG